MQNPSLNRQLIFLAIPMILSNITVPLLGLVDTAVIGHLSHAYYLGGSSIGAMIITLITWLCGFLRMSTTGLAAQSFGSQNTEESFIVLIRGLFVALLIGFSVIVLQDLYIPYALSLSGGSKEVLFYASLYSEIRIWGVPAALANLVILGWLLGHHKATLVMWLLILTNVVNLVLDVLFVVYFDWQVAGIAWATLIAEYTGAIVGLAVIAYTYKKQVKALGSSIAIRFSNLLDKTALLNYFRLNRDILIRTLCLQACFVFITFQGARLGDNIVAANAILMNFLLLISFGLDGIANAAEVLVGKAKGESQLQSIRKIIKVSLRWTFAFALSYTFVFWLFNDTFINMISDIPEVVVTANEYVNWLVFLPIIACWCYLYDGVYIGLTQAKAMRNSMIISTFLCFFPVWWLLQDWGNHGLWAAFSAFMLVRGITLAWHAKISLKI